jgi:outer membrane protein TolC
MEQRLVSSRSLGLCILALLSVIGSVGASEPLTLNECVKEAIGHSPLLEASSYNIEAAKSEVSKERGLLLPDTTAKLNTYMLNGQPIYPFSAFNVPSPEAGGAFNRNVHWGAATGQSALIDYPLFKNGSILGLNDAPAVLASRSELHNVRLDSLLSAEKVKLDVAGAFLYAVWYPQAAKIETEKVAISEKRLAIVTSEVALGLKLKQEIDLANSQLEADRRALEAATQGAALASAQLAALLGRSTDSVLSLDQKPIPLPQISSAMQFATAVLAAHPALRVQQGNVEIARQQYFIARSAMRPQADLQTSIGGIQNVNAFHPAPTLFLTYLQIDLPLFDFGQRRSATQEARYKMASQKMQLSELELELRSTILRTFSELYQMQTTLAALERTCMSAENAVELARSRREQGMIDELAVSEAEWALLAARETLESQQVLLRLKYAELQNISGGRWNWLQ